MDVLQCDLFTKGKLEVTGLIIAQWKCHVSHKRKNAVFTLKQISVKLLRNISAVS